jgi:hypothetical protein
MFRTVSKGEAAMPSDNQSQSRGASYVILGAWLAFYVLAITHSLLSYYPAAPVVTAEAQAPVIAGAPQ